MFRNVPAGRSAVRWLLPVGVVCAALLLKACAEQPPTETNVVATTPQLGAGPGGGSASCTAPCVEVVVTAKPGNQAVDGVVVTLVQGGPSGIGPFDQSGYYPEGCDPEDVNCFPGKPLKALTVDGVATFGPADFDLIGSESLLGYCATVTPITDLATATGTVGGVQTFVVPNGTEPPAEPKAIRGAVSAKGGKTDPLNKPRYLHNCVDWNSTSDAPIQVTPTSAVRINISTSAAFASLDVTCRYFDGSTPQVSGSCPTWTLIDLSDEGVRWCNRFAAETGVKCGLLASAASNNAALNRGLAFEQLYAIESAKEDGQDQFTSSGTKETPKGKGNQSVSRPATSNFDPTLCKVVTTPAESEDEVSLGPDFKDPITDGYLAFSPLGSAFFVANQSRVAIFYDYENKGGSQLVNLHLRAKPKVPDGSPTTMNKNLQYDYSACPNTILEPLNESGSSFVTVKTECRSVEGSDLIHVVHSIELPSDRQVEWRLGTEWGGSHPEEARSDDIRSMRLIEAIPADQTCELPSSTIGDAASNDPKWDIIG